MPENPLSASIGSLFHELRGAATFILSIFEALDQTLPEPAQGLWSELGTVSEQTLIEIEDQIGELLANIDSYSAATASARLWSLADGWEKQAAQLSLIADRISELHVQLEDPKSSMILTEYLRSSVRGFAGIVSFIRQIQPEEL